jgi:hypothetical protein
MARSSVAGVGVDVYGNIVDGHALAAMLMKKVTVADSGLPLGHGQVCWMVCCRFVSPMLRGMESHC